MEKKRNVSLIIGLSIPVLMIVFVAASIYLPSLFIKLPNSNFVFSIGDDYYSRNQYMVVNGRLTAREQPPAEINNRNYASDPSLYYYDVKKNSAREITLAEAQSLSLDNHPVSEEGFEIVSGSGGGGDYFFFFSYGSSSGCNQYLKKGSFSRELHLATDNYYCYTFKFLGWVKEK